MCRSIKPLRNIEGGASEQEIREAALQFVRKVSGYHKPSKANQAVFDAAVAEVALATQTMLASLRVAEVHVQKLPRPAKAPYDQISLAETRG